MADRGQFRMDDKRIRGFIVMGAAGPIPSTFRMTFEAVDQLGARRKRTGEPATVHAATITVHEPVQQGK